jgi:hypothetical protein
MGHVHAKLGLKAVERLVLQSEFFWRGDDFEGAGGVEGVFGIGLVVNDFSTKDLIRRARNGVVMLVASLQGGGVDDCVFVLDLSALGNHLLFGNVIVAKAKAESLTAEKPMRTITLMSPGSHIAANLTTGFLNV